MSERSTSYFLTLLRHGESVGNASGIWQGHNDSPLTALGRAQAAALGQRWLMEQFAFDYVIASPLSRAFETASIIAEILCLKIEKDPIWMERDNGSLSGQKRSNIPADAITGHLYEPMGETGESEYEVFIRAGEAISRVMGGKPGRYLIVSHGGLLNRVMYSILGIQPQASGGIRFAFGNTGFSNLEFQPKSNLWLVKGLNDQTHLSGSGPLPVWQG